MPTPIIRTCPDALDCPADQPLDNFSSEADDTLDYISTTFLGTPPPPLLNKWSATSCGITYISTISQLDADLQAAAAALQCVINKLDPTPTLFLNAPQTCCVPCPDGSQTCYTFPGGLISGINQASADSQAHSLACSLINKNMVCLGNVPQCMCVGDTYLAQITASVPVVWTFTGGSLPPGLSFAGGIGLFTTISGMPLAPGQYTFSIQGTTPEGPYSNKLITMTVLEITTMSLPPFTVGVPYSFQLQAIGGSSNYAWKITNGTLPNGLTMSITGLISGTPQ